MGALLLIALWCAFQFFIPGISIMNDHQAVSVATFAPWLFGWGQLFIGMALIYGASGFRAITEWDRVAIFRFGRYVKTIGPGLTWVDPIFHRAIDGETTVNDQVWELVVDNAQTNDTIPVGTKSILTWRVTDVRKFVLEIDGSADGVQSRAMAAIAHTLSSMTIEELLANRGSFNTKAVEYLREQIAEKWGVLIIAIELQEIVIQDESIKRAMSLKAAAQREGEAEVVRAQKQAEVARHLQEAATIYSDPIAMELRRLDTLAELGRGTNNMILFPTSALDAVQRITGSKNN